MYLSPCNDSQQHAVIVLQLNYGTRDVIKLRHCLLEQELQIIEPIEQLHVRLLGCS